MMNFKGRVKVMTEKDFLGIFQNKKPIIGMLHLKGETDDAVMERLKKEVDIYVSNGLDSIIVENYYGTYHHMVMALEYVREQKLEIPYGVNCLNGDTMGFELSQNYGAAFVQLDSVVGHVKPEDEEILSAYFETMNQKYSAAVLGGVRFKYQPVLSKNSVEEDLRIARGRCAAVCVTQDATGQETSMDKIRQFRSVLGDFPLIVGAGLTPENMQKQFAYADGAVVGSYFKDTYKDTGDVSAEHVQEIMRKVKEIRENLS